MDYREIAEGLKALGLKKGSIVLLHSSFVSLGEVANGPEEVIKAFLSVIGKSGTLLVPVFGKLGVLTEILKAMPGAVVSSAPVGTLAAIGKDAEELLADHWKAETAHGKGTPFTRIAEKGGYICLLGVDQDRNTTLHSVEALLELPYLGVAKSTFKNPAGKTVTKEYKFYPGPHRDFIGIDHLLLDTGAMQIKRIGNAQVRLIDSAMMFETLLSLGAEHSDLFLCSNPACDDCVRQRSAIFKADLAGESFKLTASAKLAGRYVPEIVENLKREGISFVELDCIQGKVCASLPAETLKKFVEEFASEGIEVSALRCPAVPDDAEKFAAKMKECSIRSVILPADGAATAAKALKKAGIALSLANTNQTALRSAALYEECSKVYKGCRFAFNGANFAAVGENPFLYSYRIGRFIRKIGQLDIADALQTGEGTEFACGNGEIRELVSILRCANFDGFFCLGGGAAYPGSFAEAAEDFRTLLANI
ncbi:MAG: AAC(3) family N-acetyltransferase [Lentisphaeria bacterium]|nr:AAC(3) family N-acetyltransferase [Lentisphaeria bacterium]